MNLPKIIEKDGRQAVSARELYKGLGLSLVNWAKWYRKNIVASEFAIENVDWEPLLLSTSKDWEPPLALSASGKEGQFAKDFALSIEFAKRLAMMARTEAGEKIRLYFIECEKKALGDQKPLSTLDIMEMSMKQMREQQHRIESVESKIQAIEIKLTDKPVYTPRKVAISSIHKRLEIMIAALGLTKNAFAVKAGMSSTQVYNFTSLKRNKPSAETLARIKTAFPIVNISWVITGEGTALIP